MHIGVALAEGLQEDKKKKKKEKEDVDGKNTRCGNSAICQSDFKRYLISNVYFFCFNRDKFLH